MVKEILVVSTWITGELIVLMVVLAAVVQSTVGIYFDAQYRLIKRIADERLKPPPPLDTNTYDRTWQ
jgi:hypothetical protein